MSALFAAVWAEGLKIYRSKIFWISALASVFMPIVMASLMFVAKNPDLAYKFGLLGTKATVLKIEPDWPTYFSFLNMAMVGVGLIGFGFMTSWVFGREYSDRTAKDLMALPVSRELIVLAKFAAVAVWCVLLSLLFILFGLLSGAAVGLAGWSKEILYHGIYIFSGAAFLTILLSTPVAFFAGLGRGYLAPVGFVILALMVSQFIGALGLAEYFPWAVPMLLTEAAGAESVPPGTISYIILYLTSLLGLLATLAWWRYADQY